MECHTCPEYMNHQGEAWEATPCSVCVLREDSYGTRPYRESEAANAVWDACPDETHPERTAHADTARSEPANNPETDDPLVPISVLADALSLWLRLSLPARKVIQLRMAQIPYSEIGRRLGCSRQAAEKLVAQALAREPLLGNLLPAKSGREAPSLPATRTSAIAGRGRTVKGAKTAQ